jgi:hypothetical protein
LSAFGQWSQSGRDIYEKNNERSGNSVSINGDETILAEGSSNADPGKVRVYDKVAGNWQQI